MAKTKLLGEEREKHLKEQKKLAKKRIKSREGVLPVSLKTFGAK